MLAEVDHVRAYRGETGELLYRMRTAEAEEEFMRLLDGGAEPDWFVERWDEVRKVLVACLVFEKAEGAKSLAKLLSDALADGTAKHVRFLDDAAMREEVAEWFSAKWAEAHAAEMAKVGEEYAEAVKEFGGRIAVGWVPKEGFDGFSLIVKGVSGVVAHAAVKDEVLGRVNVCLGFDGERAAAFCEGFGAGEGLGCVCVPRADVEDEVPRQMVVAMARRLRALDAKKDGGAGEGKSCGKDEG